MLMCNETDIERYECSKEDYIDMIAFYLKVNKFSRKQLDDIYKFIISVERKDKSTKKGGITC